MEAPPAAAPKPEEKKVEAPAALPLCQPPKDEKGLPMCIAPTGPPKPAALT